jgi:hypothetical protein
MNKHLILVRYIAPTNYRPSRISLTSGRSRKDKADRIIISYDYTNSSDLSVIAAAWLKDVGYTIYCTCETPDGVGILVNEFEPLKVRKSQ